MAIGGLTLVVLLVSLIFGRGGNQQVSSSNADGVENSDTASSSIPQEPVVPNIQIDTTEPNPNQIQGQNDSTEATLTYWQSWKSLRESYAVAAEPLLSEYSIENSITLSALNTQTADQLGQLSAIDVDPELTEIAANAIVLYRDRARLFQEQANLLSKWATFVQKRDSDVAAGAQVLVFLFNENDRFAVSRALAEEANQIKSEWNNNSILFQQLDQNVQAMIAQRDAVRIKLESRYGVVFENE